MRFLGGIQIWLVLTVPILVGFSGCGADHTAECQRIIRALTGLQPLHLTALRDFDPSAFRIATAKLIAQHRVDPPKDIPDDSVRQCAGALDLVSKRVPKAHEGDLALELITNYTSQWDPHSVAYAHGALGAQGGYLNGFGFTIERTGEDAGRVEIVDVIAGSPAHNAGIEEGMFIGTVNHRQVREISTSDLAAMINDPDAKELVLGVGGASHDYREITVARGTFEASPIKISQFRVRSNANTREHLIGYLKIRAFSGAQAFFAEALKTLKPDDALILDLRNIAGGDIQAAADLANLLLSNAENFVGFIGQDGRVLEPVRLRTLSSIWDAPIIVLVDATTKSAAEILAGTLQDYGAIVVGTATFGKGTRQTLYPLNDYGINGGLYLTDAFTVRPSGKPIQLAGITPDVTLPFSASAKRESSYPRALAAPPLLRPLSGYDPTNRPSKLGGFRARISALESRLGSFIRVQGHGMTREDLMLEAAKRVAVFVASDLDEQFSNDKQLPLPFED
jgi:carboxyl-terminal processing protease